MTFELRAASDSDDAFLLELYGSVRESELALTGWTEAQKSQFVESQFAAQKRHYAAANPDATHSIIEMDGVPVGRLYLARRTDRIHILDITIAPAWRNRGLGTALLREILEEAGVNSKSVTIYAESFNPSIRLFERLGFRAATVDGFLILMQRHPAIS